MNDMQKLQDLYTEKLAHYNEWLMDNKRSFGRPYPGFPKQKQIDVLAGLAPAEPEKKSRAKKTEKVEAAKTLKKAVKATRGGGGTKLEMARALYAKANNTSRDEVVAMFMSQLGMTKAGATTYFYNVRKV